MRPCQVRRFLRVTFLLFFGIQELRQSVNPLMNLWINVLVICIIQSKTRFIILMTRGVGHRRQSSD